MYKIETWDLGKPWMLQSPSPKSQVPSPKSQVPYPKSLLLESYPPIPRIRFTASGIFSNGRTASTTWASMADFGIKPAGA